jgi:UDP-GlcNAc:undecaprenyl-phosphate GlcNAc-1-phosphate transferase
MSIYLLFIGAAVSAVISACICFLILRWRVLDVPDDRSAHIQPMPTLGGLAILLGTSITLALGGLFFTLPPIWFALSASTVILCVLVYDEIRPMGRIAKFVIQCGASLVLIGGGVVLDRLDLPFVGVLHLSWAAMPVTFLWLVGVQNIYNFMDGIDGLASVEGFLVSGLIAGLAISFASSSAPVCFVLAGSALGFLFFNFPPARIFMGDVGSHFLGLMLGVIAIWGEPEGVPFWIVVLCLGTFLYDGIYTLLRRLFRGENITQAHRFHLYQRLNRLGWTYRSVLSLYGGFTGLLGIVGYLYLFGFHHIALGFGCVVVVLMVIGTAWIERRWRAQK